MSKRVATKVLSCALLATTAILGEAQTSKTWNLPTINLAVAYRLFEDGKLGSLVYLAQLYCGGESCELITAGLNGCLPLLPGEKQSQAFEIGLTRTGTDDGSLEIVGYHCAKGQGAILVKKHWMGADITYRFGFTVFDCTGPVPAIISILTSFDGAAVHPHSDQVESWTLVPFKGAYVRWTPDCPLVLPGVTGR